MKTSGAAEDDVDRPARVAVEVGRQDLDRRPGPAPDGQDAPAEVLGAAVGQVVAGHRRDHDVPQAEPGAGLGQPVGLVERDGLGMAALDRAEAARAGADLAQDHERRRPPGPAFRAVRAAVLSQTVSSPSSATRLRVKDVPPAAGIGRLSHSGSRRCGARRRVRLAAAAPGSLDRPAPAVHPGLGA